MKIIRLIFINLFILALILFIVEGLTSYILTVRDIINQIDAIAERRHTEYDPELGWVNKKNMYMPDLYGPGISLATNSQRFRNQKEIDIKVPKGKYRIFCSGDSFTLGYGVSDNHTWCHRLTIIDPRLETVNMGQGGYGVDQAYLWFKRDGAMFERNMHILAFISDDFYRMQLDSFFGYGKPKLRVENEQLRILNVPVPKAGYHSKLTSSLNHLKRLRTVEFTSKVIKKLRYSATPENERNKNWETKRVLVELFQDLKNMNEQDLSLFVLVYLPTLHDLKKDDIGEWSGFIEKESLVQKIPFLNIMDEFKQIGYEKAEEYFIPESEARYLGAAGHLNNKGNDVVARMIYAKLKKYVLYQER